MGNLINKVFVFFECALKGHRRVIRKDGYDTIIECDICKKELDRFCNTWG